MMNIKKIHVFDIDIKEPSGLAVHHDGKSLWTVSDKDGSIFRLGLNGKILAHIKTSSKDLEGITALGDSNLAVISERKREVHVYSLDGILRKKIELPLKGKKNKGIEGITCNPDNGHFFILNEDKPKKLYELDSDFTIVYEKKLKFSKDLSGICYDSVRNELWIISDESKLIARCTLKGDLVREYGAGVKSIEGVAVSTVKKSDGQFQSKLYVVSDSESKLYVFQIDE